MGKRVEFWEQPSEGIKESIIEDFSQFKEWYEAFGQEEPEFIDYDLYEVLESNSSPDQVLQSIEPETLDTFISVYLGDFCDFGPGEKIAVKEVSFLDISNYLNEQKLIEKHCSPRIAEFWDFIINGRSFSDPEILLSSKNTAKYCFFSEAECKLIKKELTKHFDTSTSEQLNDIPAIGSVIQALQNKSTKGLMITTC